MERRKKRPLRTESASLTTAISTSDQADLERQLTFNLRDSFIQVLQSKSVLALAQENYDYYERVLDLNRKRYEAGDIARADLDRLELQKSQYESDLENARVNLRTAKLSILALLNDERAVDDFDVTGDYDFRNLPVSLEQCRRSALASRPDLTSASIAIEKAQVDNQLAWANGSTDPIVGFEYQRTPGTPNGSNTMGFSITIPLRIFDRNQGEKARTAIEINRAALVKAGLVASIYRDVSSAYTSASSVLTLLGSFRDRYLPQATSARDTVAFAYQHGGASLLEFLDAQKAYRDTQLNYRNLIATYLSAVNQLNLAVGNEVVP